MITFETEGIQGLRQTHQTAWVAGKLADLQVIVCPDPESFELLSSGLVELHRETQNWESGRKSIGVTCDPQTRTIKVLSWRFGEEVPWWDIPRDEADKEQRRLFRQSRERYRQRKLAAVVLTLPGHQSRRRW